jgi:hypothetical protein
LSLSGLGVGVYIKSFVGTINKRGNVRISTHSKPINTLNQNPSANMHGNIALHQPPMHAMQESRVDQARSPSLD